MLTVQQAAKKLHVSDERVCQLIRQNRLYAIKVGRVWMIPALKVAPPPNPVGRPRKVGV